ncbi:MAG: hypothetical protein Q8908_13790 [Bacteroidota bacterium]|nr:hypothetical protein [Bacteroidota bacterium]
MLSIDGPQDIADRLVLLRYSKSIELSIACITFGFTKNCCSLLFIPSVHGSNVFAGIADGNDRKPTSDYPNTLLLYPFNLGNIGE